MNVWTSVVNVVVWLAEETAEDTEFDPNKVTPGVEGFLMTGLMALMVIGLGFVLVRRMRANNYRHDVREQIEAELAEAEGASGAEGTENVAGAPAGAPDRDEAGDPGVVSTDGPNGSAQK